MNMYMHKYIYIYTCWSPQKRFRILCMTVSRFSISCYARWSLELAQLVVLTPWNFSSFQPRALPRWWLRPCCWAACFAHQTQVSPFGSFRLAVFALERGASPAFWIPLAAFCCVRFVNSFLLGGCVTTTGLETSHLIGVGLCPWCRAGCVRTPSVEPARLIVLANCQAWFARQSMEPAWLLDPCVRFFSSAPLDDWKNGLCFRWCWAISLKAALFRGNVRQALPSRQEMGPACLSRSRVKLSRDHHGAGGKNTRSNRYHVEARMQTQLGVSSVQFHIDVQMREPKSQSKSLTKLGFQNAD